MRDKLHQKNPTNADLTRKETTELKRYKKYITPYLSAFVIGPLMMLTEVAGEVMLPKFMSMIINNGVASRNVAYIGKMGALMGPDRPFYGGGRDPRRLLFRKGVHLLHQ